MTASALLAVSAPIALVVLALGLASIRERSGPCRPRYKCRWEFLASAPAVPIGALSVASAPISTPVPPAPSAGPG